ncbi:MAG: GNAT family N-acetyltransferase [Pseudomonadota bacterium]
MAESNFTIRPFSVGNASQDAEAFARLNQRWIEEYFGLEDEDRRVLEAPEETILAPGGYIAVAEQDGAIIGTGALMVAHANTDGGRVVELVKMATDPSAQGTGVGGAILDHLIGHARSLGADLIWLETNDKLGAATRLYARKGFRPLEEGELLPTPYSRCNLQMVLKL